MLQSASTEDSLAPWRKEEIWMFALVVDDERSVRDALSRALRSEGYDVHLAASGGDALGFLADQAPDVIVFDTKTVADKATYVRAELFATGMQYVLVNGRIAVDGGKYNGILAGRPLRRRTAAVAPVHNF